jgi:hypothetical protein
MSTRDANYVTDREVRVPPWIAADFTWQGLVAADRAFDEIEEFLTSLSRLPRQFDTGRAPWLSGVLRGRACSVVGGRVPE